MNLKNIITSQLDSLGLGKFKNLAADIESHLEPLVEITVRKKVVSALTRVCNQARKTTAKSNQGNHEKQ
ncbi:MAG: hypothetical protein LV481_05280 [Methylacidiphilales bacterium]|nr:hypothetical protein [Candidatus Methylacidiphilales bacterium]